MWKRSNKWKKKITTTTRNQRLDGDIHLNHISESPPPIRDHFQISIIFTWITAITRLNAHFTLNFTDPCGSFLLANNHYLNLKLNSRWVFSIHIEIIYYWRLFYYKILRKNAWRDQKCYRTFLITTSQRDASIEMPDFA